MFSIYSQYEERIMKIGNSHGSILKSFFFIRFINDSLQHIIFADDILLSLFLRRINMNWIIYNNSYTIQSKISFLKNESTISISLNMTINIKTVHDIFIEDEYPNNY